jgi:hypothetical protein
MRRPLSQAWGEFLSGFNWEWFLTLTFREPQESFRAHRLFRRFAGQINRAAGNSVAWFMVFEYGSRLGRLHIHALMLNVAHLSRFHWMEEWNKVAGYARILPFAQGKGAAFYCAKYVTKSAAEWEIVGVPTAVQQVLALSGNSAIVRTATNSGVRGTQHDTEERSMRYAQTKLYTVRRDWESDMLLTARRWTGEPKV